MLAASLLALIDVIAIIFWMTRLVCRKLPQKKTAGVLGDDLALNALQISGVEPMF